MEKSSIVRLIVIVCIAITIASFKLSNIDMMQGSNDLNVEYGSNTNVKNEKQSLKMDIYLPPNAVEGKKYPMIMIMHGGGFLTGKKEDMAGPCKQLADSGFVTVSIEYRMGWNFLSKLAGCNYVDIKSLMLANYRAMQDAHAAMRFLKKNAGKYQIDTDWLFIGGSSAGAVTALNVAYVTDKYAKSNFTEAYNTLGELGKATNKINNDFKIKGICSMWGALPDSGLVTKDKAIPAIFYHGTADATVPYNKGSYLPDCPNLPQLYGSACIYRQTIAAGQPAVLNTSIGGKHGPAEFTRAIMAGNIACFFHRLMQGKATSAAYTKAKAGCL
jgi:poly(3-hydroxybutyrate) depolymerase